MAGLDPVVFAQSQGNGFNAPQLNPPPINPGSGNLQPIPNARIATLPANSQSNAFSNNAGLNNANLNNAGLPAIPNSGTPIGAPGTASGGTSETPTIASRNLLQMFHDGGWMMYPIAVCSFVLTVFIFERLIALRTGRVISRPFTRRLVEQLQQQQIDREEALELCQKNPSMIAQIMVAAVKKYGRSAVEVEQAVLDAGERVSNQMRKHLRILNAISNVAPLLGLLGTVLGMIEAFKGIAVADAATRSQLLAGGIGHAMLTTAGGLLVAIPAYLAYMYFLGRSDKLLIEMDSYAQQVVEAISAEGLAENDSSRSRSRSKRAA